MNELTANPLFQSGVLPFIVALITALALRPLGWRWAGLGFAVAFAAALHFITGFQITPFTSTRKIILLTGGAVVLGLLFDILDKYKRYLLVAVVLLAAAAATWLSWPIIKRLEGEELWITLAISLGYSAWLIGWTESLKGQSHQAAAAALALGVGTSISAVLGASALYGQLGGTIAAAAGAFVLLLLIKQPLILGSNFTLPVATASALIAVGGVHYAGLTQYALIPLALIPLFARIPVKQDWHSSLKTIVLCLYTMHLAGAAISITWVMTASTGDTANYGY